MSNELPPTPLKGSKALVVGVANQYSIAYGCAKAFRELGAELAITYVNEKTRTYVEPLAKELEAPIVMPLDVGTPGMLEAVFERIAKEWGRLDVVAPLDRVRAERRSPRAAYQLLRRRLQVGDGRLLPLVRTYGAAGGAIDERRRDAVRDELLRCKQGRTQLQRAWDR